MSTYELTHLPDDVLLGKFAALAAQDRRITAALLAHIAEIDARHLYLRLGFESMRAYCMHELHLTEDAAAKRLQVARLARQMPVLFSAIADGRLHLTAVSVLATHLTPSNIDGWIADAAHKTVAEIMTLIARRHPQAEALRLDDGISPQVVVRQQADPNRHAAQHVDLPRAATTVIVQPRAKTKVAALSPERYTLQVTLAASTHDKLRRAQQLLGHAVPSGSIEQVLDRALDALLANLERTKFGRGAKDRKPRPAGTRRSIPSQVRRAVYERDGGRCSFVEGTRRCGSRQRIEFDHVVPLARGGKTTVANLRLLCRAHNRYEAERVLGREHMQQAVERHRDGSRVSSP